jgi:hypothetical protein
MLLDICLTAAVSINAGCGSSLGLTQAAKRKTRDDS